MFANGCVPGRSHGAGDHGGDGSRRRAGDPESTSIVLEEGDVADVPGQRVRCLGGAPGSSLPRQQLTSGSPAACGSLMPASTPPPPFSAPAITRVPPVPRLPRRGCRALVALVARAVGTGRSDCFSAAVVAVATQVARGAQSAHHVAMKPQLPLPTATLAVAWCTSDPAADRSCRVERSSPNRPQPRERLRSAHRKNTPSASPPVGTGTPSSAT